MAMDEATEARIRQTLERCGLGEWQRRQYLAIEAKALGHGGVAAVARVSGASESTIRHGIRELESGEGRTRRPGGGRKKRTEEDPGIEQLVLDIVDGSTYGDPMRDVAYTTKSVRNVADAVEAATGESISHETVRSILEERKYSLKGNRKCLQVGKPHPDRDGQISLISERTGWYVGEGLPAISIDAKKKELLGNYKNGGREWSAKGAHTDVLDHDFMDRGLGKAVPYGVYDIGANEGYVSVGNSADTAEFCMATLQAWWDEVGKVRYPGARALLVTCDGGGSNGARCRLFKLMLQQFADRNGIMVEVHHFTPGNSKFNKIERRLFSEISKHWRGKPLTSLEVVRDLIASTTTRTGLKVRARIDRTVYQKGIKVSDEQMSALSIVREDFHPEWNYMMLPRPVLDLAAA
jgi:transposase